MSCFSVFHCYKKFQLQWWTDELSASWIYIPCDYWVQTVLPPAWPVYEHCCSYAELRNSSDEFKTLNVFDPLIFLELRHDLCRRQRGRAVRALELQSEGPEFNFSSKLLKWPTGSCYVCSSYLFLYLFVGHSKNWVMSNCASPIKSMFSIIRRKSNRKYNRTRKCFPHYSACRRETTGS